MRVSDILPPGRLVRVHDYLSERYVEMRASEVCYTSGGTIDGRYRVAATGTYLTAEVAP